MALGFMIFMRGVDITQAIGRVGLKVSPVLGPNRTHLRHIINRLINSYYATETYIRHFLEAA